MVEGVKGTDYRQLSIIFNVPFLCAQLDLSVVAANTMFTLPATEACYRNSVFQ